MMMWNGFTNELNKSFLNDGIEEKGASAAIGSTKDTYQSILQSIWPVYEYYYRFIKANSIESTMYVLDSFLEEYHSLSALWGVSSYGVKQLWTKEEEFNDSLNVSKAFFTDSSSIYENDSDIEKAKDLIFSVLVNPEHDPEKNGALFKRKSFHISLKDKKTISSHFLQVVVNLFCSKGLRSTMLHTQTNCQL